MSQERMQWRERRRRQRIRRIVISAVLLAFGAFFFCEINKWKAEDTSVVPEPAIAAYTPIQPTKTPEQKKRDRIFDNASQYPADMLAAVERNPEILDFVSAYLTTPAESAGGISKEESRQKIPLFIQWDKRWGYVPYGQSNVGISGCGPTCLSMVLYSLTRNETLTPDLLSRRAMEEGYYVEGEGTSWLFMLDICEDYGVKVSQYSYMELEEMAARLDEDKLIICAMGPGDFTDAGHFIVVRGHHGDKLVIHDPFSKNNSSRTWDYDRIASQIQKCWVYEK